MTDNRDMGQKYLDYVSVVERFEDVDFDFGTVFRATADGFTATDDDDVWESGLTIITDPDESLDDSMILEALHGAGLQNWEPVKGWTGQHGYRGPVMHPSEVFRGSMAADVWHDAEPTSRYVMVYVDTLEYDGTDAVGDPQPAGWMLLTTNEPA